MSKDKLADLGFYTVHPINLYKVMTEKEYSFLEFIRNRINLKQYDISYSLFMVEMGFTSNDQIKKIRNNLIKLGFISILGETQKGTRYKVLNDNLKYIVEKLNNVINPIKRLEIADDYRISKGLKPMNENIIKKFKGSSFDFDIEEGTEETKELLNNSETSTIKECKEVKTLNKLYYSFLNGNITEREYKLKSRTITETNNKIIFNKETEKWISIY